MAQNRPSLILTVDNTVLVRLFNFVSHPNQEASELQTVKRGFLIISLMELERARKINGGVRISKSNKLLSKCHTVMTYFL